MEFQSEQSHGSGGAQIERPFVIACKPIDSIRTAQTHAKSTIELSCEMRLKDIFDHLASVLEGLPEVTLRIEIDTDIERSGLSWTDHESILIGLQEKLFGWAD